MGTVLFVGGIPWRATEDELRTAFLQAGEVVSVKIITDRDTGRSKGYAFVEMGSPEALQKAIEMWNGKEFGGRPIVVNAAKPREERPVQNNY